MKTKKSALIAGNDLSARIDQTAANKLLDSVAFPFTLVHNTTSPPGYLYTADPVNENEVILSRAKIQELLNAFAAAGNPSTSTAPGNDDAEAKFNSEALSNIAQSIESAKACLRAMDEPQIQTSTGQTFSFPDRAMVKGIVDGGVAGLLNSTTGLEMKAICSELKVIANNRPNLSLNGQSVGIGNSQINVRATGELWGRIPSLHCSRWCTNWTLTWRWVRLASVSVSVTVALDAGIQIIVNGKILNAKVHVNRLRLDYPILREIPLEGIANNQLENKLVQIFDAGSFIACLPVINSKFGIESITIPNNPNCIQIEIGIKQL